MSRTSPSSSSSSVMSCMMCVSVVEEVSLDFDDFGVRQGMKVLAGPLSTPPEGVESG